MYRLKQFLPLFVFSPINNDKHCSSSYMLGIVLRILPIFTQFTFFPLKTTTNHLNNRL